MKMNVLLLLVALLFAEGVRGHGYLTVPPSRTRLGFEAGKDTCPECQILEPVAAWPDVAGAQVGRSGPCGYNARSGIDYNKPGSGWGNGVVATYKRGEVIDVQWCVDHNGDHGGMFSYRVCQDEALVKKFLDPNYLPTNEEKQRAEDCFQKGILPCHGVNGQTCNYNPDCQPGQPCYRNDWFTCGRYTHNERCKAVDGHTPVVRKRSADNETSNPFCDNTVPSRSDCGFVGITESECASRACCWDPVNDGRPWCFHSNDNGGGLPSTCKTTISHGYTVSSRIRLPDFASNHTLLSFRWSSYETPQVYLFCSDIALV